MRKNKIARDTLPKDKLLIIAHRGASAYAPEHTMMAYEMARSMGADYIEIDLNRTKDGKLVAIHDEVIPYVAGEKMVSDFTLDELKQFSPGIRFNEKYPELASPDYVHLRIPELTEIFHYFNGTANFYIELKSPELYPGIEKELWQHLFTNGLLQNGASLPKVIVQSFDARSLIKLHKIDPSIPLIQLHSFKKEATFSKSEIRKLKRYASGVGLNVKWLTREFTELMQREGLHVHPYTVNEEEALRSVMGLGVNGLFTDKTDVAIRILDEFRD